MSIQEFHAKLSSNNTTSALFGSLRKLMSLSDLKPARFQESSEDDGLFGAWVIWNETAGGVAATA